MIAIANPVLSAAIVGARDRHAPAVRQVAAARQRRAHDWIAGLTEGELDGEIGGRAGIGLDVYMVDTE